jgi:hypothetical protein
MVAIRVPPWKLKIPIKTYFAFQVIFSNETLEFKHTILEFKLWNLNTLGFFAMKNNNHILLC